MPALIPYHSSPMAHTSWYGWRRRSHWSATMAAKTNDSTELRNGRTTLRSTAKCASRDRLSDRTHRSCVEPTSGLEPETSSLPRKCSAY